MTDQNKLKSKLKNVFGYDKYKKRLQRKATEEIYKGNNDVYICMPSGFGKSLCFQLPIIAKKHSFSIVISPTIAIAKNQVDYLRSKKISSVFWCSYTSTILKWQIQLDILSDKPEIKFIYITPKEFMSSHIQHILSQIKPENLSYIVIDEVHCISKKSHDFRISYQELIGFRTNKPNLRLITLTSTATEKVEKDILNLLGMKTVVKFKLPRLRSNLFYDVRFIANLSDPITDLIQFIEKSLGSTGNSQLQNKNNCGIIFCENEESVKTISESLASKGIQTMPYFTRSKIQDRFKIQELWRSAKIRIIITAAKTFGIGITKQSVRFIVHWYTPLSIERYYQESGRAGHDINRSYCRIYADCDKSNIPVESFIKNKKFASEYEIGYEYVEEECSMEVDEVEYIGEVIIID